MPFQFRWLCELFEELQQNQHKKNLTTARARNHEHAIIHNWYQRFDKKIERSGSSAIAFLSCLLPERRPDRVYSLQANRLSRIFGRALGLGSCRALQLNQWRGRDGVDFPTCVELTLQSCENDDPAPGKEVTLEEVDEALELIAAHSPSSSPAIRAKITNETPTELLTPILHRLKSNEAKWFARMLLKSYAPIQVPEYQALHGFHFMLPNLLVIQNSFYAAITTLANEQIRRLPARPIKEYEYALQPLLAELVQPRLNVMIKRQPYHKARSIKNCCALANNRQMSIERKYDGEYCQIHIDMSKGLDCIKIFSKSGKDSTMDRVRLHGAIKDALRIGRDGCRFRHQCIIEGELLVWSSSRKQIQPFHKIRKYVKHGGRSIGTAQDSPPRADDQLMIAFYDLLVLDDIMLLCKPHSVRRRYLKMVLQTSGLEGRAILAERKIIDFRSRRADEKLREAFATAITQRWEGLVLKDSSKPYYDWSHQLHGIKLKKDYITGMGDIADLCIVGGRRDPHAEQLIGAGTLRWTSFYVGAVTNMEAVRRFDTKPQIKIIDVLTHHSMPVAELLDLNRLGRLLQIDYAAKIAEYDIEMGHESMPKPTDLFKKPFIVEIMGAGFEKLSNSSFFTLRFPRKADRKVRLHTDRTLLETLSFSELQAMAERSMAVPVDQDSQDDAYWIEQLIQADGRQLNNESSSQATSSNRVPCSPSAISLSPIDPRRQTTSPIFVRPDTEEPKTQESSFSYPRVTQEIAATSIYRSCSSTGSPGERFNKGLRKRRSDVLTESTKSNLSSKRPCLQSLDCDQQKYQSKANDSTVQSDPRRAQRIHPTRQHVGSNGIVSVTLLQSESFSSLAESCVPPSQDTGSAPVQGCVGESQGSLATPDSTLVMRQIMSVYHHQGDLPTDLSPTHVATSRESFHLSVSEVLAFKQPYATPLLLTPPTSSPVAEKSATITSKTNQRTLQQVKHSVEHQSIFIPTQSNPDPTTSAQNETIATLVPAFKMTTAQPNTPHPQVQQELSTPIPILILTPNQSLISFLPPIKAPFTFSKPYFTNDLVSHAQDLTTPNNHQYHIILVDTFNPEATGNEFRAIINILEQHPGLSTLSPDLDTALGMLNDKILVFDQRVLEHEDVLKAGLGLEVLQKLDYRSGGGYDAHLFCGVVRFYKMVGDPGPENAGDEAGGGGGNEEGGGRAIGLRLEYSFAWVPYDGGDIEFEPDDSVSI